MPVSIESLFLSGSFTTGRRGLPLKYIVIHHWDDPAKEPTFAGVVNWFASGTQDVSTHYVVEAGRIAQLVADTDTAWHAGNWNINLQSIGIECNPRCSPEDLQTLASLVTLLYCRHGHLAIIGHSDCFATSCPGRYYPPGQVLAPYLNRLQESPYSTSSDLELHALALAVIRGDYGNGNERRDKLGEQYEAVQKLVNELFPT